MKTCLSLLSLCAILTPSTPSPCSANEILLRNGTCHCPFFQFNGLCLRHRYQTTVNTTIDSLLTHSRHLLSEPLIITIDASTAEAMQALADSLDPLRSVGTVVTRVVDSVDTLVGGDASATLEIVNVSVGSGSSVLTLTVDCRLPPTDFLPVRPPGEPAAPLEACAATRPAPCRLPTSSRRCSCRCSR
jgi:hypothetical protein